MNQTISKIPREEAVEAIFSKILQSPNACARLSEIFYEQLFLKKGLPFQVDTEVATTDQVLPLVKNDLGLGFLPEPFAEEALVRGEVYRIPLADQIPKRQVCMVKDSSRTLSKSCSLFLESTELGS